MAKHLSFGSGLLLRAMVLLAFLSGLVAEGLCGQAAIGGPLLVKSEAAGFGFENPTAAYGTTSQEGSAAAALPS